MNNNNSFTRLGNIGLVKFIETYRNNPCLWDINDDTYWNVNAQNIALRKLLATYKKYDEKGDLYTVRLLLDTLRLKYERELHVIQTNIQNGFQYNPEEMYPKSPWYLQKLQFLGGMENIGQHNQEQLDEAFRTAREDVRVWPDAENMNDDGLPPSKRIRGELTALEDRLLTITERLLAPRGNTDELHAFGCTVGASLKTLNPHQQVIAQRLVSEVIYLGKLNRLDGNISLLRHDSMQPRGFRDNDPPSIRLSSKTFESNILKRSRDITVTFERDDDNESHGITTNSGENKPDKIIQDAIYDSIFEITNHNHEQTRKAVEKIRDFESTVNKFMDEHNPEWDAAAQDGRRRVYTYTIPMTSQQSDKNISSQDSAGPIASTSSQ